MAAHPSGTVTPVFTDAEGSTALLDELGAAPYREALAGHRRTVREAFGAHDGYEVDEAGDGLFYAFASASGAVSAAADAMASLGDGPVRIRAARRAPRAHIPNVEFFRLPRLEPLSNLIRKTFRIGRSMESLFGQNGRHLMIAVSVPFRSRKTRVAYSYAPNQTAVPPVSRISVPRWPR